jgi:hypothetical protein
MPCFCRTVDFRGGPFDRKNGVTADPSSGNPAIRKASDVLQDPGRRNGITSARLERAVRQGCRIKTFRLIVYHCPGCGFSDVEADDD